MTNDAYETHFGGLVPIKSWTRGVPVEGDALDQLRKTALLPFVHPHVAVMPDVHLGIGATVGSVVPTVGAIVPAAVGVDIGCGMMAVRTSLTAADLPDSLAGVRSAIEDAVPVGRAHYGQGRSQSAFGSMPSRHQAAWKGMKDGYATILAQHPSLDRGETETQLGTLGGGNHFIEVCLDESEQVWVMLHSGSRGVGNRIGSLFIELARRDLERLDRRVPHRDLAYFEEGTKHFDEYVAAVGWAQQFAKTNRELMMHSTVEAMRTSGALPAFTANLMAVECHHNYVAFERHFETDVIVTRKGAVRAGLGEMGIIPGSMGAKSFIVRGKGNAESLCSCSHGAGRVMSRTAARKRFTVEDHAKATAGIECRKDEGVIDETPKAYKDIDAVMAAQEELVEIVHTLRQVVCVKG